MVRSIIKQQLGLLNSFDCLNAPIMFYRVANSNNSLGGLTTNLLTARRMLCFNPTLTAVKNESTFPVRLFSVTGVRLAINQKSLHNLISRGSNPQSTLLQLNHLTAVNNESTFPVRFYSVTGVRLASNQKSLHNLISRSRLTTNLPTRFYGVSSSSSNKPEIHSMVEKAKAMVKQYGYVGVGTYIVYDVISIAGFYILVKTGFDVKAFILQLGFDLENSSWLPSGSGEFVIAFAAHKIFAPVRYLLTVGTVPYVTRVLEKFGYVTKVEKMTVNEVKVAGNEQLKTVKTKLSNANIKRKARNKERIKSTKLRYRKVMDNIRNRKANGGGNGRS